MSSCLDTIEDYQIVGQYYLVAIDLPENLGVVHYENNISSGGNYIVTPTVFEIEWNDEFIVAKQHPQNNKEDLILSYFREYSFDSLKRAGNIENLYATANELSKAKFELIKKSKSYVSLKSNKEATLFYIIDIRKNSPVSKLYLSRKEFEASLIELNVGKLEHRKYYDYLDK